MLKSISLVDFLRNPEKHVDDMSSKGRYYSCILVPDE